MPTHQSKLAALLCSTALGLLTLLAVEPAGAQNLEVIKKTAEEDAKKAKAKAQAAKDAAEKAKQAAEQRKLQLQRLQQQRLQQLQQRKLQAKPAIKPAAPPPPVQQVKPAAAPVTPPVQAQQPPRNEYRRPRTDPSIVDPAPPPAPPQQAAPQPAKPPVQQVQPNVQPRRFRQISRPVVPALAPRGPLPTTAPLAVRLAKPPQNLNAIKANRTKTIVNNRVVIQEPGRTIVKQNNRSVVVSDENARLVRVARTRSIRREDGTNVTIIQRPNNVSIYNVTNEDGQLVRRYRRDARGNEFDIIDNRHRDDGGRRKDSFARNVAIGAGVGLGVAAGALLLKSLVDVPKPRVVIPQRKYVVDYDEASDDDVYEAVSAPPVDVIERRYTLDEVRATRRLRDRMRRIDLNDINFEFGSWEVDPSQYGKLERVARAMRRVIENNQNEVFMIEGYTDAVGSDDDNLTLSDRRAESVAVILTEQFDVPPENLTTQGYGEQYLKVKTLRAEVLNRRVAVRRITPLISQNGAPPPPQ